MPAACSLRTSGWLGTYVVLNIINRYQNYDNLPTSKKAMNETFAKTVTGNILINNLNKKKCIMIYKFLCIKFKIIIFV